MSDFRNVAFHKNFVSHVRIISVRIEYYYISFPEIRQKVFSLHRYAEFYQVIPLVGRTLAFVFYFQTGKNVAVFYFLC